MRNIDGIKNNQRRQVKQSPINQITLVFSHKYLFSAVMESKLEVDYFNYVHFCFNYPDFHIQPDCLFYYDANNKAHRYTPDASYVDDNGELHIVEVKYQKEANKPDIQEKHALIAQAYLKKGMQFHVITEKTINQGERADNLRLLQPCWAFPAPEAELNGLLDCVEFTQGVITDWMAAAIKHGVKPCLIKRAIAHRLLLCDITRPWRELTLTVPA